MGVVKSLSCNGGLVTEEPDYGPVELADLAELAGPMVLGQSSASTAPIEAISATTFGLSLLAMEDAAAIAAAMGLGSAAFEPSTAFQPAETRLDNFVMAPSGIIAVDGDTVHSRSIAVAGDGLSVENANGVAGDPTLSLTASGVVPGTYQSVTVDELGRVTDGAGLGVDELPGLDELTHEDEAVDADSFPYYSVTAGNNRRLLLSDLVGILWRRFGVPTGTILANAGSTTPTGYLKCDGTAYSRSTYSALFAIIGTTWGVGDGSTTFNVPNLSRRALVGSGGTGNAVLANTVGSTGGSDTVALTTAEMPSHAHTIPHPAGVPLYRQGGGGSALGMNALAYTAGVDLWATNAEGSGDGHSNIQQSAIVAWIIKY